VARIHRIDGWPKGVSSIRTVHLVVVEGEQYVSRCGQRWPTADDCELMSPAYRGEVCADCEAS
jgi:hypothetical protein